MVQSKRDMRWEQFLAHLSAYVSEHGQADFSSNYVCADGFKLGATAWRVRHGAFVFPSHPDAEQRRQSLRKLGFGCAPNSTERWTCLVSEIQQYRQEKGHAEVPPYFVTRDGMKLGAVIARCRTGTMLKNKRDEAQRRTTLNQLGVPFNVYDRSARW